MFEMALLETAMLERGLRAWYFRVFPLSYSFLAELATFIVLGRRLVVDE